MLQCLVSRVTVTLFVIEDKLSKPDFIAFLHTATVVFGLSAFQVIGPLYVLCKNLLTSYNYVTFVWDSGENLSDHIPLCLVLSVNISDHLADRPVVRPVAAPSKRLHSDKADLVSYYYGTYNTLSQEPVSRNVQRCEIGCANCVHHMQYTIDSLYSDYALMCNSNKFVPRGRPGFYKPCWNETQADLKKASIAAHLWKVCSCPISGDVLLQMKRAKLA